VRVRSAGAAGQATCRRPGLSAAPRRRSKRRAPSARHRSCGEVADRIAFVATDCSPIFAAAATMRSGVSSITPFGATGSPRATGARVAGRAAVEQIDCTRANDGTSPAAGRAGRWRRRWRRWRACRARGCQTVRPAMTQVEEVPHERGRPGRSPTVPARHGHVPGHRVVVADHHEQHRQRE